MSRTPARSWAAAALSSTVAAPMAASVDDTDQANPIFLPLVQRFGTLTTGEKMQSNTI